MRKVTSSIIGLGPGAEGAVTPDAQAALGAAQDIIGYGPYVARVQLAARSGAPCFRQPRPRSNAPAMRSISQQEAGRVAVVSSGDPGVFCHGAAAIFEALEADPARWEGVRDHGHTRNHRHARRRRAARRASRA